MSSKNKFKLSEDKTYWIGYTQKGEEFWFDGQYSDYIMNNTWRKINGRYFQNGKGEKLHRVVMGVTSRDLFVNNKTLNDVDNRTSNLEISSELGNFKNKRTSSRNASGITGLMARGKSWVGNVKINDISLYSKYKSRDEAIIDMLIMQKHYGFKHNQHMYYLLEDVSEERWNEVISNCERQLKEKKEKLQSIETVNEYELSECGNYYTVYDDNSNSFIIDAHMIDIVKKGKWFVAKDKSNFGKLYVKGTILVDGARKSIKLHRYLFDITDNKYKKWYIDHINGNPLDNRFSNMVITDALGNGHKNAKGYARRTDVIEESYRASITLGGKRYSKTFKNEQEAIEYVALKRKEFLESRLQFKTREELDVYLKELNNK